jgi:hypothetical protein
MDGEAMNSLGRLQAREWLADHLLALHWTLLILWVPPVAYTIAVNLRWVEGAGSGYLRLSDPSLLLAAVQLLLLAGALPGMSQRYSRSWWLAAAAVGVWMVHAAWNVFVRVRLSGSGELLAVETLSSLAALLVVAGIVADARYDFTRGPIRDWSTVAQPAVRLPGTTSSPASRSRKPESRVG